MIIEKDYVIIEHEIYGTRFYPNSAKGRKDFAEQCNKKIVDKVFEIWGDTTTEEDFILPDLPILEPLPVSLEQRIADLEEAYAISYYGGAN